MSTLKSIWKVLNSTVFLYVMIIILIIWLSKSCGELREERRSNIIDNQNIIALNDSIKREKLKNGNNQVTIAGHISSINDLKKLNRDLYDEIKQQHGKVISLNKIIFQLRQDTFDLRKHINYLESIMGKPVKMNDSTYSMSWILKYDWDSTNFDVYKGNTYVGLKIKPGFIWKDGLTNSDILNNAFLLQHQKTEMIDRVSQMELVFGQKIEKDQLRIFVNTKYPGFTASSLEGVLIDPNTNPYIKKLMKKKQWFPNTWAVGFGASVGYNIFNAQPYIGVGMHLTYNIFQW